MKNLNEIPNTMTILIPQGTHPVQDTKLPVDYSGLLFTNLMQKVLDSN